MTHAVDRWRTLADERGFVPALVFVPRAREGFDDRRWRAWLAAWAETARVPYLDLTEALRRHGPELHLPNDTHWSAAGHTVVAEAVEPFVAQALAGRTRLGRDVAAMKLG